MASRIMHYGIAQIVSQGTPILDMNRFLWGALAPDLSNHEDGSYALAHFSDVVEEKGIKGINWGRFGEEFRNQILTDDFFLGYFVHLISDACWLKDIQQKYVRSFPKPERREMILKGYEDMKKCNPLLIKEYQLKNMLLPMEPVVMKEIDFDRGGELLLALWEDFAIPYPENEQLDIYDYEAILSFIEKGAEKCLTEITALKTHSTMGDPRELYVPVR
jgi:hypothetical protein